MSMIDVKLETFVTVCETKSFTKTGELLGLTQPAVSQHIKRLEDELAATLFLRKKGELILSKEGEIVLLYAKRMKALCEKMRVKVKNAQNNMDRIRIGITHTQESGFVTEVLSKIAIEDDNLQITFITDNIKNLYDMLENFEIDMAIIEGKPTNPSFNFVVVNTDSLMCIVSAQSHLAHKASITLAELKREHLILRLPGSSTRAKFEAALDGIGESIDNFDVTVEVDSIATIRDLVKKDFGVSVLARYSCINELQKGTLCALPIENLSMIRETTIVYHKTFTHTEIVDRIAKNYNEMVARR